ncbi:MAG: hypothetical protein AABZ53_16615 [Planctomycetota bacterium]
MRRTFTQPRANVLRANSATRPRGARAYTVIGLVVPIVIILAILIALIVPMLASTGGQHKRATCMQRQLEIATGTFSFAMSNKDQYPLPSALDAANTTINADASSKDTTANIISTLIFGRFFTPRECVSPFEQSRSIAVDNDYQYTLPQSAANPKLALWDPGFSADFTSPSGGNLSFALMLVSGPRLAGWSLTHDATKAILGDRGPKVSGVIKDPSGEITPMFDAAGRKISSHRSPNPEQTNVVYNDGHISSMAHLWGERDDHAITYTDAQGLAWPDLLHYDEPDDKLGTNNFLGIFTTSGKTPGEFKAIWD